MATNVPGASPVQQTPINNTGFPSANSPQRSAPQGAVTIPSASISQPATPATSRSQIGPTPPAQAQAVQALPTQALPAQPAPVSATSAGFTLPPTVPSAAQSTSNDVPPKRSYRKYQEKVAQWADATRHNVPSQRAHASNADTVREFDHKNQRKRLFINGFLRLLNTVILCGLCGVILATYGKDRYLTNSKPRWFNTLITALPIGVSLSITSSLRSYAKMLRWRILASKYWSLKQFDMVLDAAEQTSVLKLLWNARRRRFWIIPTLTQVFCAVWLTANLGGAITIALLGLTYSVVPGSVAYATTGNVSVLDMSYTYTFEELNNFMLGGGEPTGEDFVPTNRIERQNFPGLHGDYEYCIGNCPNWTYTFQDQSSGNASTRSSSGRTIFSIASCKGYNISSVQDSSITYVGDSGQNVTQDFAGGELTAFAPSNGGMTYIYRNSTLTDASCGERCAIIYGWQAQYSNTPPRFYECTNTVSQVYVPPDQISASSVLQISAINARRVAVAIAGGTYFPDTEYCVYAGGSQSPWLPTTPTSYSTRDGMDSSVATTISQFSMTAVAASDQDNKVETPQEIIAKRVFVTGRRPYFPPQLTVSWIYAGAILVGIPLLQAISLVVVIALADTAVVKDDSHFSTAKLLEPLVRQMGDHGCLLTGDEIVELLGGSKVRVTYGSQQRVAVGHVGVFEEGSAGSVASSRFQEGLYDGREFVREGGQR